MRLRFHLPVAAAAIALMLASACSGPESFYFGITETHSAPNGASIKFSANQPIISIEVRNVSGTILYLQPLAGIEAGEIFLPDFDQSEEIRLVAFSASGLSAQVHLDVPAPTLGSASLRPLIASASGREIIVPPGTGTSLLLSLEGVQGKEFSFTAEISAEKPVLVSAPTSQASHAYRSLWLEVDLLLRKL